MNAIQELRVMIGSELERIKFLLSERRRLLLAGVAKSPVCFGVSQRVRLCIDSYFINLSTLRVTSI